MHALLFFFFFFVNYRNVFISGVSWRFIIGLVSKIANVLMTIYLSLPPPPHECVHLICTYVICDDAIRHQPAIIGIREIDLNDNDDTFFVDYFTDQMQLAFEFVDLAQQIRVVASFQHGFHSFDSTAVLSLLTNTLPWQPSRRVVSFYF